MNAGTSSLVLLSVLSRSKKPMYGYQIAKHLEASGPQVPMMKQGTLYPVLRSLEENGTPEESASAYNEVERRTSPALKQTIKPRSALGRFFGVYADPYAWGALLYMLIAFVTGIFYFTWAVTGVSLSISLLILVFGFPLALLFLLSVRGLALLEGRLVEALLGVRMPRNPLFSHQYMKWFDRLKALLTDKVTWVMLVYMLLQFLLGTVHFVLIVTA